MVDPFVAAVEAEGRAPSLERLLAGCSAPDLVGSLRAIEVRRRNERNLYRRVRLCAYAAALCRYALQDAQELPHGAPVPEAAWRARLDRRFGEAVDRLWSCLDTHGVGRQLLSELGAAYRGAQYDELARQVRASVRRTRGNAWLFRGGHQEEHPLRIRAELLRRDGATGLFPVLRERTPVRLDLTHSGWSDIFFLAMEAPELARVINVSIDLAMGEPGQPPHGSSEPPITACVRVIDEPVLRLTAIDLAETRDLRDLDEIFDFGSDHLGLLKAAIVAAGIVPPACEGTHQSLTAVLAAVVGRGMGLELCSQVAGIPKGSRLAVSTNLLASLVAVLMRATRQTGSMVGPLNESERRVVAGRAILGEWLGGSGGGWQDSGGVWPGIKIISGMVAREGDREYGVSRGCLLPQHRPVSLSAAAREALQDSLVVFHGGMAGNVGPVLELVTDKHLLGWEHARAARDELQTCFDGILAALRAGDCRELGRRTQAQFLGPLQQIIPGVNNAFTQTLIETAQARYAEGFFGFVMLGGMSGGGMAMLVDPAIRSHVETDWPVVLRDLADGLSSAMPFAIEPVLCRVAINDVGTVAELREGREARLPEGYYKLHAPVMARARHDGLSPTRRQDLLNELEYGAGDPSDRDRLLRSVVVNLLPDHVHEPHVEWYAAQQDVLAAFGHDANRQERLQDDLRAGRISLERNRLSSHVRIESVPDGLVCDPLQASQDAVVEAERALADGAVAIVALAGGLGSRWSGGSGVVKALSPFTRLQGRWRSFLELHLLKRKAVARSWGSAPQLVVTSSHMTHAPLVADLERQAALAPELVDDGVSVSRGMGVMRRVVPMERDLHCWFSERPRARLDEQAEKARADCERAWIRWARSTGEGGAYTDNEPSQALAPPGHWWEVPNLLLNGTLSRMLEQRPQLRFLMMHNVDTLGATLDPVYLAAHIQRQATFSFEVVERLSGDAGGSLALVDGHPRLIEGLAVPDEALELGLRYYNTNSCWIDIDGLLRLIGLDRRSLADREAVAHGVSALSTRLPTYVTIKEARRRWGHGQEDTFPVGQFEQLWGDMTGLTDLACSYVLAPRQRGQQLKDVAQLADWYLDGSRDHVATLAGLAL